MARVLMLIDTETHAVVPREPTEAMWEAGREPLRYRDVPHPTMMQRELWWNSRVGTPRESDGFLPKGAWADLVFSAMLMAAPPPSAAIEEAHQETRLCEEVRLRMQKILTETANALKGEPAPLQSHSWHDLAAVAARLRQQLDAGPRESAGWQWRQYFSEDDPGWSEWRQCSREEAEHHTKYLQRQVREVFVSSLEKADG